MKSSIDEIRERFDRDVDRFSNLETGQSATIDAPLVLELIAEAVAAINPGAARSLDVGCGAGNYTLKLLQVVPLEKVDLVDLSRPMLDRAVERISDVSSAAIQAYQQDIREVVLEPEAYDVIVAAATLHHLRTDGEWTHVFSKLYHALKRGGSLWIADLVQHSNSAVQALMWRRYGDYLLQLGGRQYRDQVFDYIEKEDSPRSLMYQLDLLRAVGFASVDVLHKNGSFAAFGGIR